MSSPLPILEAVRELLDFLFLPEVLLSLLSQLGGLVYFVQYIPCLMI